MSTKVSELPSESVPTATDYVVLLDTETNTLKKVLVSELLADHGLVGADGVVGINKGNLTTDANPYKFRATRTSTNQTITTATWTTVQLNTEEFDTNNNFDTSTYKYTVPVDGFYMFVGQVFANTADGTYVITSIYKNASSGITGGTMLAEQRTTIATSTNRPNNCSYFGQLVAGDTITLVAYIEDTTTPTVGSTAGYTSLSGFLVCRT